MGERVKVGRFRNEASKAVFYEAYDELAGQWPVPHTELDIETSFGTTHLRRSGPDTGVPLVLLHPVSGSSVAWRPLISSLGPHHPIYAVDTLGAPGRSIQARPIATHDDAVAWFVEVLDELGVDRCHLVGYSDGGAQAGRVAAAASDRLASLALIEPGPGLFRLRTGFIVRMVRMAVGRKDDAALRRFSDWLAPGTELGEAEIRLIREGTFGFRSRLPFPRKLTDDQLRGINVPTLVLIAGETVLCDPDKVAERARRLLPNVIVEVVLGAGHGLPFERPSFVGDRVARFVAATEATNQPT